MMILCYEKPTKTTLEMVPSVTIVGYLDPHLNGGLRLSEKSFSTLHKMKQKRDVWAV